MIERLLNPSKSQSFFLFGPRGSGKSTLLKELFRKERVLWIDLLEQREELRLSLDPDSLIERWKGERTKWVVIDEIQKIPSLLDTAHRGIESHGIRFAMTGSSARKLKRGGANLLAGRAASYSLAPFAALELGTKFQLRKALALGLLPRFWSQSLPEEDAVRSLYSYVQTYLKEEIASEQLVRNLDPFRRVLVAAAQSNGQPVNYAHIERDAGVRHSQAERHFEILVDTLVGRYLEPYNTSVRKRQTRRSKFYFFDTGIVRALTSMAGENLVDSTYEYGALFETLVINEFFKLRDALEKQWQFSYLRTKDDVEVDLIIDKPRGPNTLIEIKSSRRPPNRESLRQLIRILGDFPKSSAYWLSNCPDKSEIDGIRCLHWLDGIREIFGIRKTIQSAETVPGEEAE